MDEEDNFEDDELLEDLSTKELVKKLTDPETEDYDKSYICFILDERKDDGEDISAVIPALKKFLLSSNSEAENQIDNVSLVSILISHYAEEKNWNEIKELLQYKNDLVRKAAIGNLANFVEEGGDISPLIPYFKDKTDSDSTLLLCMHYLEKGEFNEVRKYYQGADEEHRVGAFHAILETAKRGKDVSFFMDDIQVFISRPKDVRTTEIATMISVYQHAREGAWQVIDNLFRIGNEDVRRGVITVIRNLPALIQEPLHSTAFKKEHIHPTVYKLMEEALYDENHEVRKAASIGFTLDIRQDILEVPDKLRRKSSFMDNIHEENRLQIKVRSLLIEQGRLNYIDKMKEDVTPLLMEFMADSAPEVATNSTNILLERLRESVFEKIDRADYFTALQEIKDFSNMVNRRKGNLHPKLRRGIISFLNDLSGIVQDKMNRLDAKDPLGLLEKLMKNIKDSSAERKTPVKQR